MKTMAFLRNPRGARKHRARAGTRKTKRRPPKGFRSWKAYMASIRPKAKRAHSSGGTMHHKHKTHHKARHTAARKNPARRHAARKRSGVREFLAIPLRKRARRNPSTFAQLKDHAMSLPARALHTTAAAGAAIVAKATTRTLRGKVTTQAPGTITATLWEILFAQAGGLLLALVNEPLGFVWALGGMMAPGESLIQQASIPFLSAALGDDGFLIGPGTGVMLVSAHPADYQRAALPAGDDLGNYVTGPMGNYVTGPMGNYVTGPMGDSEGDVTGGDGLGSWAT